MAKEQKRKIVNNSIVNRYPFVSLPSIILTRVNVDDFNFVQKKKSVKANMPSTVNSKKKKASPLRKMEKTPPSNKASNKKKAQSKISEPTKTPLKTATHKKSIKTELANLKKKSVPKPTKKVNITENKSKPHLVGTKNKLKKTMLKKNSKVLAQVKKPKASKESLNKKTPIKVDKGLSLSAPEIDLALNANADSSEDEFVYDELIEENNISKGRTPTSTTEKNTITIKPSTGNKSLRIVSGGIIKRDSLPADLKTIASPGQGQQLTKNKAVDSLKRAKESPSDCPIPEKKISPWPITMSKQTMNTRLASKSKISLNSSNTQPGKSSKNDVSNNNSNSDKVQTNNGFSDSHRTSPILAKPRIGPKQTATITPASKTINDNDSSDEYTDEETLEDCEDIVIISQKITKKQVTHVANVIETKPLEQVMLTPEDQINLKVEESKVDLLNILSDEHDKSEKNNTAKKANESIQSCAKDMPVNEPVTQEILHKDTTEEPKVRTIYDLINEVTVERPSWNLHIIPETNAFCIAQVTKGRLGLPTLKKCIELDPDEYSAKVYIHQYHIKRFDGIYDSEDSILALIEEIDSIKA